MKSVIQFLIMLSIVSVQQLAAQFEQEPLPYAYDDLEPYIDARTMQIHYNKHHAGYISNLNKAVAQLDSSPESLEIIFKNIADFSDVVRNNAGGHYNHNLFWSVLTPIKGTKPSRFLTEAINDSFISMEMFKESFLRSATSHFGSGWVWLIVTSEKQLAITSTSNQDNPLMEDTSVKGIPIFGVDVWEHAYYLNYQNRRANYLNQLWNVINWEEVSRRFDKAVNE